MFKISAFVVHILWAGTMCFSFTAQAQICQPLGSPQCTQPLLIIPRLAPIANNPVRLTTPPPPASGAPGAQASSKPRAAVTVIGNPFIKVAPVVVIPRSGMTNAWRPMLFNTANVALNKNAFVAALPSCASGQDGNCIANAPERNNALTSSNDKDNENVLAKPIERRRALVIGNTEYASPMTSLPGTAKDAADISKTLADQGFEVVSLVDATREGTVRAFNNLIRTAGEDDSVIIYYAGHGHIHPGSATGYWLPADADAENPKTWLSNADISRMLTNIGAKQILLISDSCFSGALTREAETSSKSASSISPNAILKRRSVAVMSSGSEEPVADSFGEGNSPFAQALLKKLSNLNATKEPLRAQEALESIREEVAKNSPQTPQYGVLMSAGHTAGGDYLFGTK